MRKEEEEEEEEADVDKWTRSFLLYHNPWVEHASITQSSEESVVSLSSFIMDWMINKLKHHCLFKGEIMTTKYQ